MRSPPATALWMFVQSTAICWMGWLKRCTYWMKAKTVPSEITAAKSPVASADISASQ